MDRDERHTWFILLLVGVNIKSRKMVETNCKAFTKMSAIELCHQEKKNIEERIGKSWEIFIVRGRKRVVQEVSH